MRAFIIYFKVNRIPLQFIYHLEIFIVRTSQLVNIGGIGIEKVTVNLNYEIDRFVEGKIFIFYNRNKGPQPGRQFFSKFGFTVGGHAERY
jgi:hypothetical protein